MLSVQYHLVSFDRWIVKVTAVWVHINLIYLPIIPNYWRGPKQSSVITALLAIVSGAAVAFSFPFRWFSIKLSYFQKLIDVPHWATIYEHGPLTSIAVWDDLISTYVWIFDEIFDVAYDERADCVKRSIFFWC